MMERLTEILAQVQYVGLEPFYTEKWFYAVVAFLGASVGSFLNVAIYRIPLGLSVNTPKRSFCPGCKKPIAWYRNIPIVTWLLQRGQCAGCGGEIAVRYLVVEVVTALLFLAVWCLFPGGEALLGWLLVSLLVTISFIDGEHYVIPVDLCWWGVGIAILGTTLAPQILLVGGGDVLTSYITIPEYLRGGVHSLLGAVVGYLGLVSVVLFGKMAFGKRKIELDKPEKWYLKEPKTDEEELSFVLGKETIGWGEVFFRKTDRLEITGERFLIDGKPYSGETMVIRELEVQVGEEVFAIEKMKSLEGMASRVVIPREAMGSGDPPLLGMIGAFLGAPAVLFTIFASSIFALIAALLGRIGFGKPLPFGPFLALGALSWLFGGHHLFSAYLRLIGY